MSYTPPNQLMEEPLTKAADALKDLCDPIQERLRAGRSEWNEEHLQELNALLKDVFAMEYRLRDLEREVR